MAALLLYFKKNQKIQNQKSMKNFIKKSKPKKSKNLSFF